MDARRFGRIEIRPGERTLLVDGEQVELGSRAFDLLLVLLEHRGRVVGRDELLEKVWPGIVVEESNLQVQVFALRKALGAQAIATVSGRGYQLALTEDPPTTASPPVAREPFKNPGFLRIRIPRLALAGFLVAALGAAIFATFQYPAKRGVESASMPRAPLSIVVLPFANLTGRPDQEYIAHGLTSIVTSDLMRLRDAFIVDQATAFSYRAKTPTAVQLSRELGVRFVLQGNLQSSGERIRIQLQLTDAATGAQLWSEMFEGTPSNLFALQDSITGRVGNTIAREMIIAAARTSQQRTGSPQAADLVLRARALEMQERWNGTHETVQQMALLYRQVLALEPDHVNAMAALAAVLVHEAIEYSYRLDEAERKSKLKEAHELAMRVRSLDPANPGIYRPMASYASSQGDFPAARRALEEWVLASPRNGGAHNTLAVSYLNGGEPKRAIESLTRAMELAPKPGSWLYQLNMGRAHFMLGDYDTALGWLSRARQGPREPPRMMMVYLAMTYAEKGDPSRARAMTEQLLRHSPDFKATRFESPGPTSPPAYKEWFETKFLASARKAGIPE
jgi:TolB-like protein